MAVANVLEQSKQGKVALESKGNLFDFKIETLGNYFVARIDC